jgi:hypothetical protein
MTRPDLSDDDVLLTAVSAVIDGMDPVPPGAVRAAVAASELPNADNELAALVADSTDAEPLLLRHETDSLVLTFRSSQVTVEIEIDRDGHAVGVISPAAATDVALETSSLRTPPVTGTRSDDLGRFQLDVGPGLCRLRIGSGPEAVLTSWFYC